MGKFDGILICSDWDETFNGDGTIPVNVEAVRYFKDNGGKFTFVTGRGAERARELTDLHIHNVPVCTHNGSVVYDFENECTLMERRLDVTKGDAVDFMRNYLGNIHTTIGIGNYENDVPLLEHADIGVAVGDAIAEVKQAADIIVKPCNEFAIRDLIEILDKKYS